MKEVLHETHTEAKGFAIVTKSFSGLKRAKPATKLVFMEDFVATLGGIIAIIGILLSYFAGLACSRRNCFYHYWSDDVLCSRKSIFR